MQDIAYSDEQLTRYLLGELPEGERARIEERYLQDAEFFERLEAVESELIDEYVQGELPEATRSKFEKRFLITPHGRRKVEIHRAVSGAILDEPLTDAPATAWRAPPARQSLLSRLLPRRAAWGFAYAAAAVAMLAGAWALVDNARLRADLESARAGLRQKDQELRQQAAERQRQQELQETERRTHSAQLGEAQERERAERERGERLARQLSEEARGARGSSVAGRPPRAPVEAVAAYVFPFNPVRGAGRLETPLVIRPGQTRVPLKIDLGNREYPAYRVSLQTVEGREVWGVTVKKGQSNLKDGSIVLSPPAGIFTRKDYTLSVFPVGRTEAESIVDYSFGVERRDRD